MQEVAQYRGEEDFCGEVGCGVTAGFQDTCMCIHTFPSSVHWEAQEELKLSGNEHTYYPVLAPKYHYLSQEGNWLIPGLGQRKHHMSPEHITKGKEVPENYGDSKRA